MPGNSYSADKANCICHAMACRHNNQIDKDIAIREDGVDASSLRQFANALLAHPTNTEVVACGMALPFAYEKKFAACDRRKYYCDYWDEKRGAPTAGGGKVGTMSGTIVVPALEESSAASARGATKSRNRVQHDATVFKAAQSAEAPNYFWIARDAGDAKPIAEPTTEPTDEPTAELTAEPIAEPTAESTASASLPPPTLPQGAPPGAPPLQTIVVPSAAPEHHAVTTRVWANAVISVCSLECTFCVMSARAAVLGSTAVALSSFSLTTRARRTTNPSSVRCPSHKTRCPPRKTLQRRVTLPGSTVSAAPSPCTAAS